MSTSPQPRTRGCLLAPFALLAALLSAAPAAAQLSAGRIVGTVTDPSKAAIPRATVVVTDTATNVATTVVTSDHGDYVVTPLNPGVYSVTVTLDGFQTAVVEAVAVQVGQSTRADVQLTIGALTESTVVHTATPLLDTESGTLGHVVTNTQIVNLPLNGRSFYELARLTPGAVLLPGGGNLLRIRANYISGTAVSGVRGNQTTFMLDGADVTDHHQGGSLIQTSVDALQEFKVQQSAYTAEFSQAGGALNATTKAGADQFHGTVFDFVRDDAFDARNFFARETEKLKRQQFGGTLGGPILRKRTFFFASYEGMREQQGLVFNNNVPTAAMRAGDYSASTRIIHDPITRLPFPGNVIPTNRLNPQAVAFSRLVPDPNTPAGTFSWAPVRELNTDQFTVRIDQTLSNSTRIFGRYSFHDQRQSDPNAYPALGNAALSTRGQNVVLSMNNTLTSTLLHDVRFSYVPSTVTLDAFLQGQNPYEALGIRGFEETGAARRRRLVPRLRLERLHRDERLGLRSAAEDAGPEGLGDRRQPDLGQGPPHRQVRRQVPPLEAAVHRQQAVRRPVELRRIADPERGAHRRHRRRLRRLPSRLSPPGHACLPRRLVRRRGQLLARLHPGRLQGLGSPDRQRRPALRGTRRGCPAIAARSAPSCRGRRAPIVVGGEGNTPDLDAQFAGESAYALFGNQIQTSSQAGLPAVDHGDGSRRSSARGSASPGSRFGEKTVFRGGYGLFYEQESSGDRVNNNMVPFRLDQTAFNDQTPPVRTMADFFLGTSLVNSAAPTIGAAALEQKMGRDHHFSVGVQQQVAPFTVVEAELRRQHRPLPERHHQHQHPGTRRRRHQRAAAVPDLRQHQLLRRLARDDLPLAAGLGRAAHARRPVLPGLLHLVEEPEHAERAGRRRQHRPREGALRLRRAAQPGHQRRLRAAVRPRAAVPVRRARGGRRHPRRLAGAGHLRMAQRPSVHADDLERSRQHRRRRPASEPPRIRRARQPDRRGLVRQDGVRAAGPVHLWRLRRQHPARGQLQDARLLAVQAVPASATHRLQFRAEVFNLTNTPSFNAPNTAIDTAAGGRVTSTASSPRQMQFALKYDF